MSDRIDFISAVGCVSPVGERRAKHDQRIGQFFWFARSHLGISKLPGLFSLTLTASWRT